MIKLFYIANQRIPTEKAYGIQITKMCEAFANCDTNGSGIFTTGIRMRTNDTNKELMRVELLCPYRKNKIKEDAFDYYGVEKNFKIKRIWAPDFYWPGQLDKAAFLIKSFIAAIALSAYCVFSKADIFYSRDELILFFLSFFKKPAKLIFEVHKFSKSRMFFYNRFKKLGIKLVAITNGLKLEFIKMGFPEKNILVAPDGVDGDMIKNLEKFQSRKKLNLPKNLRIAVYTGGLYKWKGVYTLADAAKLLPDCCFVFVGGGQGEKSLRDYVFKNNISNAMLAGYIQDKNILQLYRASADVLVLPNTAKENISRVYTSPIKLFEYMASRRPIVASDLPSIREVLSEDNAVLTRPDDAGALAENIKNILNNPSLAENISRKSSEAAFYFTWRNRASKIANFIISRIYVLNQ